jgi:hypothetical protein
LKSICAESHSSLRAFFAPVALRPVFGASESTMLVTLHGRFVLSRYFLISCAAALTLGGLIFLAGCAGGMVGCVCILGG